MLNFKKLRLGIFGVLVLTVLVSLDTSVGAFPVNNSEYLHKEIKALWLEEEKAGESLFIKRMDRRLLKYEDLFLSASKMVDFHWTLLAAISYQESHWDPLAISKTGVRGLMMLTQQTAKEMGVVKRTDPEQSIKGGSLYFQKIFNRFPETIPITDRTWMSLAAYNIGFSHIKDAREFTKRIGKDADNWQEVSKALLIKGKSGTISKTRAKEAIDYVNRVKLFYATLFLQEKLDSSTNLSS